MLGESLQDESDRSHIHIKRIVIPTLIAQGFGFLILGVYSIYKSLQTSSPYGGLHLGLTVIILIITVIPIGAAINFRKSPTPIGIVFLWSLSCLLISISTMQSAITWGFEFSPIYLLFIVPGVVGILGTLYICLGQKRQIRLGNALSAETSWHF
ncbi:MAG: hypothetical protein RTU92_01480 [Candidatus Thorarchaeota archaeon]